MSGRRDAFGKFLSDLVPIEVRLRGMHLHSYTTQLMGHLAKSQI